VKQKYRRRFRNAIILQVALLVASCLLLAVSYLQLSLLAVPVVIVIVIGLQVYALLRTVASHVDTLEEFFAAINYEDFTRRFVEGDVDAELRDAFNRIIERFQQARAERDLQAAYLETVVRHLPVAFMAAQSDGSLRLVNNPARRLTGLSGLAHLDELAAQDAELPARIQAINAGEQMLLQTRLRGVPVELRVSVAEIRQGGVTERLYSLENLSGELTARESSAWRNLIRVLTHEIMNTLTPVTSLAQSCVTMIDPGSAHDDLRDAVSTIARRSEGLTSFVASYRELLKVPEPQLRTLSVDELLQGVVRLMGSELGGVETTVDVQPDSLTVNADSALLDQVLINIVQNAIDAMRTSAVRKLSLVAGLDYGKVCISVRDTGKGIDDDALSQVFVPFFTTRRDGNGIGLSLCRQIMTAHGGEIVLASNDAGTEVTLRF